MHELSDYWDASLKLLEFKIICLRLGRKNSLDVNWGIVELKLLLPIFNTVIPLYKEGIVPVKFLLKVVEFED